MKIFRIFLASSKELKSDRDQFEILIRRRNQELVDKNIHLNLFVWEDSLEALSPVGSQEEYNKHVAGADVFVLLFRNKVGKYSLEEFEKAYASLMLRGQPFIFTYFNESDTDIPKDESLNVFLARLDVIKHYPSTYSNAENLVERFRKQLDMLFNEGKLKIDLPASDFPAVNMDKIYFCDRQVQSRDFDRNIQENNSIQFALITCHDRDMAEFFVKRKKLEFDEQEDRVASIDLAIRPVIIQEDGFEELEYAMKSAIKEAWNRNQLLKNHKLKKTEEVTIEKVIYVLTELKFDYLLIAWEIKSFYWKNEKLRDFISAFYMKYDSINQQMLSTSKKIFFIGIVSYTEGSEMTLEQFKEKVQNINYGKRPIQLTKIKVHEIKDWMEEYAEERNPDIQDVLIRNMLPAGNTSGEYFFSELEYPLKNILQRIHI